MKALKASKALNHKLRLSKVEKRREAAEKPGQGQTTGI